MRHRPPRIPVGIVSAIGSASTYRGTAIVQRPGSQAPCLPRYILMCIVRPPAQKADITLRRVQEPAGGT